MVLVDVNRTKMTSEDSLAKSLRIQLKTQQANSVYFSAERGFSKELTIDSEMGDSIVKDKNNFPQIDRGFFYILLLLEGKSNLVRVVEAFALTSLLSRKTNKVSSAGREN